MNYQKSQSLHTLTHWQSAMKQPRTLFEFYAIEDDKGAIYPLAPFCYPETVEKTIKDNKGHVVAAFDEAFFHPALYEKQKINNYMIYRNIQSLGAKEFVPHTFEDDGGHAVKIYPIQGPDGDIIPWQYENYEVSGPVASLICNEYILTYCEIRPGFEDDEAIPEEIRNADLTAGKFPEYAKKYIGASVSSGIYPQKLGAVVSMMPQIFIDMSDRLYKHAYKPGQCKITQSTGMNILNGYGGAAVYGLYDKDGYIYNQYPDVKAGNFANTCYMAGFLQQYDTAERKNSRIICPGAARVTLKNNDFNPHILSNRIYYENNLTLGTSELCVSFANNVVRDYNLNEYCSPVGPRRISNAADLTIAEFNTARIYVPYNYKLYDNFTIYKGKAY